MAFETKIVTESDAKKCVRCGAIGQVYTDVGLLSAKCALKEGQR